MSTKFIHRRYITKPNAQDAKAGRKFSLDGRGGITVGYIWDAANKVVRLAVARCAMTDNFNRRVARDIVIGRLMSNKEGRNHEIDLSGLQDLTTKAVDDLVWGWLENKERIWDAQVVTHTIQ